MAASIRTLCKTCFNRKLQSFILQQRLIPSQIVRGYKRHLPAVNAELYRRRLIAGPEPERPRSEWINWNYDAEIFAFGKRLGEDFQDSTIRRAFTHRSYITSEEKRREELGIDIEAAPLGLQDNEKLVDTGSQIMNSYIKAYLHHVYPRLFEEGISDVHRYLTSIDILAHIASHLGVTDLVLCQEFPVNPETLANTLKAVIGALQLDSGQERAEKFVRDFIMPQLVENDINEMWKLENPMGLLKAMLAKEGMEPPEPRLQWSSASKTLMSVYYVGIYSDRKLLGQAPGETLEIAEEMAARDAIKKLVGLSDNRSPLPLGSRADELKVDFDRVNPRMSDQLLTV